MVELLLLGAFLGIVITVSGVGAGVVTTPALILVTGVDPLAAVASGAVFSTILKAGISLQHLRGGQMDWSVTWQFARIALPITLVVALTFGWLYGRGLAAEVNRVTAWAVIGSGVLALLSLYSSWIGRCVERLGQRGTAAITGTLIGATGVGGGIFVVPALVRTYGLGIKRAVATSIPIGLILSFAVSLGLTSKGVTDFMIVLWCTLGGLISLPLAGWLFRQLPAKAVKVVTSGLIALSILGLLQRVL